MLAETQHAERLQSDASDAPDGDETRIDAAAVTPGESGESGGEKAEFATAEEQELAAALTAILARKPRRPPHQPPVSASIAADDGADDDSAPDTPTVRRAFVSALRHQASPAPAPTSPFADGDEEDDLGPGSGAAPPDSASWLAESRRRTTRRKLKAAGAWVATVALGCVIVIVAAAILFEGPRNLEAWIDLARRTM